jgi:hypothetical protein
MTRNRYNSEYFENRKYFQDMPAVETIYGKQRKILSFLIILHLYSFFVSLIIFEFENNNEIKTLTATLTQQEIEFSVHPKHFVLVMQTFVNCVIVIVEIIGIKLELSLLNQKNLNPNGKK